MNKRTVGLKHTSWSIMHVICLKQLLEKTILHWAVVKAHPKHFCLFFKNVNYSMKFKWNINLNTPRSWLQRMKHQTKKVKKNPNKHTPQFLQQCNNSWTLRRHPARLTPCLSMTQCKFSQLAYKSIVCVLCFYCWHTASGNRPFHN